MAGAARPDRRAVAAEPIGEVAAMEGGGVPLVGGIEEGEGRNGRIVGDKDGIGGGRVSDEAGVLKHAAVEKELHEEGIGAVPGVGAVVGARPQSMVGDEGEEALLLLLPELEEEGEVVASSEKVGVEPARQLADVDPAALALGRCRRRPEIPREEEEEGKDEGKSHGGAGDDGLLEGVHQLASDRHRHSHRGDGGWRLALTRLGPEGTATTKNRKQKSLIKEV